MSTKFPTYFKCDFCYSFSLDRMAINNHEKNCDYNPANKQCGSCRNRFIRIDENGVCQYCCNKGWEVKRTNKPCKDWNKASGTELKTRASKPEFY